MTVRGKQKEPPHSWFKPEVTISSVITFLGWIVLAAGFYATTNATLKEHEKTLEKLYASLSQEGVAREKIRSEYMDNAKRTTDGISELNKQVAVTVTRYDMMLTSLNKIQESSQKLNEYMLMNTAPTSRAKR